MNVELNPGKYIVAVSGGVDSVALLSLLSNLPELDLVIAHFDHGIREDSKEDRLLVQSLAKKYNYQFTFAELRLGSQISEAKAREERYKFLYESLENYGAKAIITAHHEDDVIETAILNILRGTNRKGLSSLNSTNLILRPLLEVPKAQIINYAKIHNLLWHEDSTNDSDKYLRNYVRHNILPKFSAQNRKDLLKIIRHTNKINKSIDYELDRVFLDQKNDHIDRHWFNKLPYDISKEIMADWLRRGNIHNVNRNSINHLVIAAKTLQPNKQRHIDAGHYMKITKEYLALASGDR